MDTTTPPVTGLRILKRRRAVSPELVDAYAHLPVANVSDCMHRMSAGGARIRPMHDGTPMRGVALTVRCRPGDNLLIHKALSLAQPGDVIVVDAGGDLTNALFGEIMLAMAVRAGVRGIVLNGAIRDSDEIRRGAFPVFAAGITHRGPYKDGPGEINTPVSIDGMPIEPGDLVLGDGDGFLAVPYDDARVLLDAARAKADAERRTLADIADGRYDGAWVDAALQRLGCDTEPR